MATIKLCLTRKRVFAMNRYRYIFINDNDNVSLPYLYYYRDRVHYITNTAISGGGSRRNLKA